MGMSFQKRVLSRLATGKVPQTSSTSAFGILTVVYNAPIVY